MTDPQAFSPKIKWRPRISEAWIIAAAPLLGYLLAFLYEYGYVSYFGVPFELVSVSLTNVFVALAIVGTVVLWVLYLELGWPQLPGLVALEGNLRGPLDVRRVKTYPFFVAAIMSLPVYLLFQEWRVPAIACSAYFGWWLYQYGWPVVRHRNARHEPEEKTLPPEGNTETPEVTGLGGWKLVVIVSALLATGLWKLAVRRRRNNVRRIPAGKTETFEATIETPEGKTETPPESNEEGISGPAEGAKFSWHEKLQLQHEAEENAKKLNYFLHRLIEMRLYILTTTIVLLSGVAYLGGALRARHQTSFLVPERVPSVAVVRVYGDTAIGVPLCRVTQHFGAGVVLEKVDGPTVFRREHVGPLSPSALCQPAR